MYPNMMPICEGVLIPMYCYCCYCVAPMPVPYQVLPMNMYGNQNNYLKIKENKKSFTTEEAFQIGRMLGIDWNKSEFDVEQYRMGLDVELEHGRIDPNTNVTNDDVILTGKIALAHVNEFPDYYTRLSKMEKEAKAYWGKNK